MQEMKHEAVSRSHFFFLDERIMDQSNNFRFFLARSQLSSITEALKNVQNSASKVN